jgi:hypothetical protein
MATGALSVKLYLKPGCHLCDEAERELESLQARYPHTLERVDISDQASLMQRYGEQIPVLVVHGREYVAPLRRTDIERALSAPGMPDLGAGAGSSGSTAQTTETPTRNFSKLWRWLPWNDSRGR